MPYTADFVQQLDHLVRVIAADPTAADRQRAALATLHASSGRGEVTLLATREGLVANGVARAGRPVERDGLLERLRACGVQRLFVARDATAADLLAAARTLAGRAPWTLELRTLRASATLSQPRASGAFTPAWGAPIAAPTLPTPAAPSAVAAGAPAAGRPTPRRATAEIVAPFVNADDAAGDGRILLRPTPTSAEQVLPTDELAERLQAVEELGEATRVLEELAERATRAQQRGDVSTLRDALLALARQEQEVEQHEVRLAIGIALRRLLLPPVLRTVARQIPRQPGLRDELLHVIGRSGEEGADALIEELAASDSQSDRRAYFNALVRLPARESSLVHMLGDPRWFVVRNAADLLGELELQGADQALVRTLAHEDVRVRRSALAALGRLGTAAACSALRDALRDADATVRGAAALALGGSGWPYAMMTLKRAYDAERDADARHAIIAAFGRVASDDAVALLAELAGPGPGLLRRHPTPQRVAAVQALAEAGTPRARTALGRLARDRNAEVSAFATRALARPAGD